MGEKDEGWATKEENWATTHVPLIREEILVHGLRAEFKNRGRVHSPSYTLQDGLGTGQASTQMHTDAHRRTHTRTDLHTNDRPT
jgi:hypothetical protein